MMVKRHKRLMIVDGDVEVYTPPTFLRHRVNRENLSKLAEHFNHVGCRDIQAILEYEFMLTPKADY